MPGILRNRPRVAMIFAAMTLLLAALAVFLPSLGFAKSVPEAALSFNEGGSPIALLSPEEATIDENTLAQWWDHVIHKRRTINENTLAKIHSYRYRPAPGGVSDHVEYSLAGEDADDFYLDEYRDEDGRYVGDVYNSRRFDFEDEDDKTLRVTFQASYEQYTTFIHLTVIVTDQPEPTPEPPPASTPEPTPAPTPTPTPEPTPAPTPEPTPTGTAEKPGKPQNLSLAPGDGSLTVTWDPLANGGAASGYTVEYRPAGGGNRWARVMSNAAAASVEITGLEPGGYLVRVQAVNEIGASGWARQRTSKPARPEPTEKPGEPQNLSVAVGADSLTATWDPPADGGAASGYNVDYRSAGGGNKNKWVSVLSNAEVTSVEITGLEPDDYLVRVRAVNEIGESKRALKRVEVGP